MVAEIEARRDRHPGLFQQAQGETVAVVGEAAAIGVQVKRAVRGDGNSEAQLAQRRQQKIPSRLELRASFLEDRSGVRRESRQRGMLRRGGGGQEQILRQLFGVVDAIVRGDQPAQPPAGHAVIFAEAVDHQRPFRIRQRGLRRGPVAQAVINLVHDRPPAARLGRRDDGGQAVRRDHRAGRIGRRRQQHRRRSRVPITLD